MYLESSRYHKTQWDPIPANTSISSINKSLNKTNRCGSQSILVGAGCWSGGCPDDPDDPDGPDGPGGPGYGHVGHIGHAHGCAHGRVVVDPDGPGGPVGGPVGGPGGQAGALPQDVVMFSELVNCTQKLIETGLP